MNDIGTPAGNTPGEKSSSKFLWLKIFLAIILVILGVAAGVTYLIFAPWQEIPPTAPSFSDLSVQYRLMRNFSKEFSKSGKQLPEKALLRLSPKEINSLFRIAGNIKPKNSPYPLRYYQGAFSDNGVFSMVLPIDTTHKWLWGGTIYLKLSFTVEKSAGKDLQCRIISCKLTSLSLSPATAQKIADRMMTEKSVLMVNSVVESLAFKNGKLCIEYYPRQIMQMMGM